MYFIRLLALISSLAFSLGNSVLAQSTPKDTTGKQADNGQITYHSVSRSPEDYR